MPLTGVNESLAIGVVAEDFLKVVFQICSDSERGIASNGEIAKRLQLSPGTVTAIAKKLGRTGLISYKAHCGVSLTPVGTQIAMRQVRRYDLLKTYLVMTLGLPEEDGCDEAERLEHAVSDRLVARIAEVLIANGRDVREQ